MKSLGGEGVKGYGSGDFERGERSGLGLIGVEVEIEIELLDLWMYG